MSSMKTPGVYVVEKNAFPNSVVEVATAVPAFIGFTEKAANGPKSLSGIPWKISSMNEFVQYFGGKPPMQFSFKISDKPTSFIRMEATGTLAGVTSAATSVADTLAAAERLSEINLLAQKDDRQTAESKADKAAKAETALKKAAKAVKAYVAMADNLTVLITSTDGKPDAISEKIKGVTTVIDDLLGEKPSKTVLDLREAHDQVVTAIREYKEPATAVKYYTLQYTGKFSLYNNMKLFFANGGGSCYIVSVGDYSEFSAEKLQNGIETLAGEQEPTMVVIPEAVNTDKAQECYDIQQQMLKHCGAVKSRISILDIYDGYKNRRDPEGDVITNFREQIGTDALDYAAAYYPFLNTSIVPDNEVSFANITEGLDQFKNLIFSNTPQLSEHINRMDPDSGETEVKEVHKLLFKQSLVYATVMKEMLEQVNLLPPSAAMAGVYTLTDHNKEVWKAPANTGLSNVISTAVNITYNDQEDMNVPMNGKAVNAIRYFTGEGIKVWGARTLDGNSLDWRYINVRRTMIMLEESIKNAAKAFVFEANVSNTWVVVRSTINNFLTGIWKRGGLAGASPEDAFSVSIGLGETMTPDDILEGIMRITVLVAISHPAEFIEITFMQQMQKS